MQEERLLALKTLRGLTDTKRRRAYRQMHAAAHRGNYAQADVYACQFANHTSNYERLDTQIHALQAAHQ